MSNSVALSYLASLIFKRFLHNPECFDYDAFKDDDIETAFFIRKEIEQPDLYGMQHGYIVKWCTVSHKSLEQVANDRNMTFYGLDSRFHHTTAYNRNRVYYTFPFFVHEKYKHIVRYP